ncbi:hypothetical protein [Pseudomonas nunensis]|uniref:hypothetical protein n=1 Tax=Pseudomonas nunensis TaxID=2961896 RepID=UPI000B115C5B|nr:hypothetical protein [Pseudomonas nunensis]
MKSGDAVHQADREHRVCDGFAAERSLAVLDSCYGVYGSDYEPAAQRVTDPPES